MSSRARLSALSLALLLSLGCDGVQEVRDVHGRLAAIPGITVERTWGNDDLGDTGQVHAELHMADGTPVMLFGMGRESFDSPSRVIVARVDHLSPWVEFWECYGGSRVRGSSASLDLSVGGSAAPYLQHRFRNVADALSHPEALIDTMRHMPRCPSYQHVVTPERESRYCVQECPTFFKSCTPGPEIPPDWVHGAPCRSTP